MARGRKKVQPMMDVNLVVDGYLWLDLKSVKEVEGGIEVIRKKPRSKKYLREFYPWSAVFAYSDEWAIVQGRDTWLSLSGSVSGREDGAVIVKTEDGKEIVINPNTVGAYAQFGAEFVEEGKATAKKGRKKKKEEEEEEEKPKKKRGRKPKKKEEPEPEEEEPEEEEEEEEEDEWEEDEEVEEGEEEEEEEEEEDEWGEDEDDEDWE